MTKREITRFNAIGRGLVFLNDNDATLMLIPLYPGLKQNYLNLYDKLYTALMRQYWQIGGITINKKIIRQIMISTVFMYQLRALVQASLINETSIYTELNKNKSFLAKTTERNSLARCINMKNVMAENLQKLTIILDTNITEMENAIQKFNDVMLKPKKAIKDRKAETTAIFPGLFNELDKVKDLITKVLTSYNFDKLAGWNENIKVGRPASVRHISLMVRFLDTATGVPIPNVKATLSGGTFIITKVSTRFGYIRIPSLAPGNYTLTIEHPVYETSIIYNVAIIAGKMSNMQINLIKRTS